jgi:hypothetical protein
MAVHQRGEQGNRCQHGERDVPGDDAQAEQQQATGSNQQRRCFTQAAGAFAQQADRRCLRRGQRLQQIDAARQFAARVAEERGAAHRVERCRQRAKGDPQPIDKSWRVGREHWQRCCPQGHRHREGNQQHDPRHHCRVEEILPQATKDLFADDGREQAANYACPPGRPGWQRQRQQPAGEQGRPIP